MDRRETESGEGGELQERQGPPGEDEEPQEAPGLRGRDHGQCREDQVHQNGGHLLNISPRMVHLIITWLSYCYHQVIALSLSHHIVTY